ncbi:MAG: serine protease [Bacteroidota bacterium]
MIVASALVVASCHTPSASSVASEKLGKQVEVLKQQNQEFITYFKVKKDLSTEHDTTLKGDMSLDIDEELSKILQDVKPAVVKILSIVIGESIGDRLITSLGSGVIISRDGYIITNSHCIPLNYRSATVACTEDEGTVYTAELKKRDVQKDLALLKLQEVKDGLPYLEFGNSSTLTDDGRLFMIGYPSTKYSGSVGYYKGYTVTRGSQNLIHCTYSNCPGASGGAVVNDKKKLMAINRGVSFTKYGIYSDAIPAHTVKKFIQEHIPDFNDR